MSRVEEQKEAERREQIRLENERLEKKRIEKTVEFKEFLVKAHTQSLKSQSQEKEKQQKRQQSNQMLLAKKGIQYQSTAKQAYQKGDAKILGQQQQIVAESQKQNKQNQKQQQENLQQQHKQKENQFKQESYRHQRQEDNKEERNKIAAQQPATIENLMAQPNPAIAGPQNVVSGSQNLAAAPSTQQIIDTLVKAVHKGVSRKGFGIMHIELKDHVLSGAHLTIEANQQGVNLHIQVNQETIANILQDRDLSQALAQGLKNKGLLLKTYRVNHQTIV